MNMDEDSKGKAPFYFISLYTVHYCDRYSYSEETEQPPPQ